MDVWKKVFQRINLAITYCIKTGHDHIYEINTVCRRLHIIITYAPYNIHLIDYVILTKEYSYVCIHFAFRLCSLNNHFRATFTVSFEVIKPGLLSNHLGCLYEVQKKSRLVVTLLFFVNVVIYSSLHITMHMFWKV